MIGWFKRIKQKRSPGTWSCSSSVIIMAARRRVCKRLPFALGKPSQPVSVVTAHYVSGSLRGGTVNFSRVSVTTLNNSPKRPLTVIAPNASTSAILSHVNFIEAHRRVAHVCSTYI